VCTDCHGVHDVKIAQDPTSSTNKGQIAGTCRKCHEAIADEFAESIHGKAVAMGIFDSPTCTDCHDEHAIRRHDDPSARVNPVARSKQLCGNCHTDPTMLAKYGISRGVVETYLDSYHSWAVDQGSKLAASCTDCHTVHAIQSAANPTSSVHLNNIVETCGQCHDHSNTSFAHSYTHQSALVARGAHGWARLIYILLISFVLGGMALHNFIVGRYEFRQHLKRRRAESSIKRWGRAERMQHMVLLTSFTGLAITGFALRFPEAWWVKLIGLGTNETLRAYLHRSLAMILTCAAVYHLVWVSVTRRGRKAIAAMAPRYYDVSHLIQNMAFQLGWRKERPDFPRFDYTQKAEYWAVVWGTVVMGLTGLVLWFPTLATGWLPPWIVRVSEVVHFYEALLAVSAIFIWHFFYVIFMPSEYPVSTVWLDGRMSEEEWRTMHRGEYLELKETESERSKTSREGKSSNED